jgi:type I restriction enzyme S subunit
MHKNVNAEGFKPGWKVWRFDQIATNVNARIDNPSESGMEHYVGLEHLDSDSLKIRRWGSPDDVEATKLMFKKGDIIFGRRRAYQRKLGVAEFDGICSAHAMVLRAKPKVVLPEFLPFFMQSDLFMDRAVEISVGSLSPTINWQTMSVQTFALPPLDEQARLIELLSAALESADASKDAVIAARKMLRSSLVSIFALDGHSPATSEICHAALRPRWKLLQASELCIAPITKGATPPGGTGSIDTGIPFLKVYNLTFDGNLDFTIEPTFISEEAHTGEVRRSQIAAGDVLMNIVGPPLGKVSVVPSGFPSANINQAIARFRMPENSAATFMAAYLLSDWAQRWFSARSKKTSGQKNLTLELCQTLPVPFPPEDCLGVVISSIEAAFESVRLAEARRLQVDGVYKAIIREVLGNV